jgi:hypothetical protein
VDFPEKTDYIACEGTGRNAHEDRHDLLDRHARRRAAFRGGRIA